MNASTSFKERSERKGKEEKEEGEEGGVNKSEMETWLEQVVDD